MRTTHGFSLIKPLRKLLLTSAIVLAPGFAHASTLYDNNVVVDLSVLDSYGSSRPAYNAGVAAPTNGFAPSSMPKSRLHPLPNDIRARLNTTSSSSAGASDRGKIVLKRPGSTSTPALEKATKPSPVPQAPVRVVSTPKPVVHKKVEQVVSVPKPVVPVAPKPVEVVKAPEVKIDLPAVKAEPAPKVTATEIAPPKPLVKDVKPVETAAAPAPAPVVMPKIDSTPAPAAVMAEAPPPPPSVTTELKDVTSVLESEQKRDEETTVAALPPSNHDVKPIRVAFDQGQSKLPKNVLADLNQLADTLRGNTEARIQLLAYAGGDNLTASKARRLSLSRALAVRTYLIGEGVASTRIGVRALGNKTTEQPLDRVDVEIVQE